MNAHARTYRYYTTDVFTGTTFGGNPLAVVLDADDLDTPTMQKIAREFNYSETTFIKTPSITQSENGIPHFCVRIFTPQRELPFAGHPTIGTAAVLAHCGKVMLSADGNAKENAKAEIILEEGVGNVAVQLEARQTSNDSVCFARLKAAQPIELSPEPAPDRELLARVLSLEPGDIGTQDQNGYEYHPVGASTGMASLNVPVRDRATLARARIQPELWERHLKSTWAPNPYLFTFETEQADSQIRARKFALSAGIFEDPATGSAATTLAGYLAIHEPAVRDAQAGSFDWRIEQGYEMGRPSILEARAIKSGGAIQSLGVGGNSVIVCEGFIRVP